jgi:hypothetical protein
MGLSSAKKGWGDPIREEHPQRPVDFSRHCITPPRRVQQANRPLSRFPEAGFPLTLRSVSAATAGQAPRQMPESVGACWRTQSIISDGLIVRIVIRSAHLRDGFSPTAEDNSPAWMPLPPAKDRPRSAMSKFRDQNHWSEVRENARIRAVNRLFSDCWKTARGPKRAGRLLVLEHAIPVKSPGMSTVHWLRLLTKSSENRRS